MSTHAQATLLVLVPLLIGCGGGDRGAGGGGRIEIDGSSTVYPITEAVAEEFRAEAGGATQVTVGVSGTGGGFKRFCAGETHISNASRPIKEEEQQACEQAGVEYLELAVAYDGMSVVANPGNRFLECLTVEELRRIWEPASTVRRWSDVRPGFPDATLSLYGPGTDSGTFDYFTEAIMGEEDASRADYTASEDDNVLVQGVSGDPNALGYFGYAYYQENQDRLKLIGVDNGSGCVLPSEETIASGEYAPLSRPIFIYVNREALAQPHVAEFVRFYLESADDLVAQVGYIPLEAERYEAGLQQLSAPPTE
ncbi:MAG: PstS family phosphate ABC transporter substrate-binding protein [Longimicrobiales bacterium]